MGSPIGVKGTGYAMHIIFTAKCWNRWRYKHLCGWSWRIFLNTGLSHHSRVIINSGVSSVLKLIPKLAAVVLAQSYFTIACHIHRRFRWVNYITHCKYWISAPSQSNYHRIGEVVWAKSHLRIAYYIIVFWHIHKGPEVSYGNTWHIYNANRFLYSTKSNELSEFSFYYSTSRKSLCNVSCDGEQSPSRDPEICKINI